MKVGTHRTLFSISFAKKHTRMLPSSAYSGQVSQAGLRHGQGTYSYGTGFQYTGQWQNGLKHGFGKFVACDGSCFEGQFNAGEISGPGKRTWPDGSWFEGQFVLGEMSGRGRYAHKMKDLTYEGEFKHNKFHGKGKLVSGGYEYIGDFENHKRHGQGEQVWRSGSSYEGQWSCGRRQGLGKSYDNESGVTYEGRWSDDTPEIVADSLHFFTLSEKKDVELVET